MYQGVDPRRRLENDLCMDELLHMREDGLSNREIADRLGVSRATVYKYLGKQPAGIRYRRPAGSGAGGAKGPAEPPTGGGEPRLSPCRQVWQGKVCRLEVDFADRLLRLAPVAGEAWEIDQLPDMVGDLVGLMRLSAGRGETDHGNL